MNPALRNSAAHVFVENLAAPLLDPDDEHHLFRVLRLRDGELVTATDGHGSWRELRVTGGGLAVDGDLKVEPAVPLVTIAVAIPKGDRLEWMVQKLTEVGVREILLVDCARSVVRWDAGKVAKQLVRLERIAREAAMQSRSVWRTQVQGPVVFAEVAARERVVLAEPDAPRWGTTSAVAAGDVEVVVIGPEGGFSPDELALVPGRVGLSDQVLRVETAALVAAVLARQTQ
ncbi:MAG TPA: 16S rRNA (uracil(1498)-N(3))-methyltransferase [Ilumatobacteraceae bacterium]|nr:16S rRNA (uracil(1498)-N(3))-methyltransferase [Ilumatobacteraceae bacterium]